MRIESDLTRAAWIGPRLAPFGGTVHSVVPAGFEAYARVLHPVELHSQPGALRWADVARQTGRTLHARAQFWRVADRTSLYATETGWNAGAPRCGELQPSTQNALLATFTGRARCECIAAIWEGWGFMRCVPEIAHTPRLKLPHRSYVLYRGDLADLPALGVTDAGMYFHFTPGLLWPADASWCVSTEVDFDSTLVAGPRSLVQALLTNPQLEVFEVEPVDSLAWDGDSVNALAVGR